MTIDTEQQLMDALRAEGFDVREGIAGGAYVPDTGDTVVIDADRSLWFYENSGVRGDRVDSFKDIIRRLRGQDTPEPEPSDLEYPEGLYDRPNRPPACFVGRDRLPEDPNQTRTTPDDQEGDQDRNQDVGTRDPQGP